MLRTEANIVEPYHLEQEYNEDNERESVSDGEFASDQESDQLDRLQSNDWCVCVCVCVCFHRRKKARSVWSTGEVLPVARFCRSPESKLDADVYFPEVNFC